jgi:drug/metabolite transporter (DMT)-like permease
VGFAAGADPWIGAGDLLLLALLGIAILPISLTLITRATHHVPAPEVNLVALLETLLGPLWVWLAIGERPSVDVLSGGILVVGAVTIHSVLALRAGRDEQTRTTLIV